MTRENVGGECKVGILRYALFTNPLLLNAETALSIAVCSDLIFVQIYASLSRFTPGYFR